MAESYLEEARTETAEADYGDAVDLAEGSQRYSEQAIALIRTSRDTSRPPPNRVGP
jgi:hypothetical protein